MTVENEKSLTLLSALFGKVQTDWFGMQKAYSVRLSCDVYPAVEVIADTKNPDSKISKNNVIIELCRLGIDSLTSDMTEEQFEEFTKRVAEYKQHDMETYDKEERNK